MPVDFSRTRVSDLENRLRLLYCIKWLEPVSNDQLWPFVAQLELMEYVSMCLFLDELRQSGALAEGSHALSGKLYLTAEGHGQLNLFQERMPLSERERIDAEAPAFLQALRERQQLRVMWELAEEGRRGLLCTVRDGDLPTMMLRLITSDRKVADSVAAHFRDRASRLLLMLYTRGLMLNVEQAQTLKSPAPSLPQMSSAEDALAAVTPDQAYLCPYGLREQLAAICLPGGQTRMHLALLLPGRSEAFQWAHAAMNDPDLYNDILDLLTREEEP
ncbi:MAG: DUF4364 family protein [Clostridiales bacterium]|nr:DUF4364 family protein [Clostridiales bacterium]